MDYNYAGIIAVFSLWFLLVVFIGLGEIGLVSFLFLSEASMFTPILFLVFISTAEVSSILFLLNAIAMEAVIGVSLVLTFIKDWKFKNFSNHELLESGILFKYTYLLIGLRIKKKLVSFRNPTWLVYFLLFYFFTLLDCVWIITNHVDLGILPYLNYKNININFFLYNLEKYKTIAISEILTIGYYWDYYYDYSSYHRISIIRDLNKINPYSQIREYTAIAENLLNSRLKFPNHPTSFFFEMVTTPIQVVSTFFDTNARVGSGAGIGLLPKGPVFQSFLKKSNIKTLYNINYNTSLSTIRQTNYIKNDFSLKHPQHTDLNIIQGITSYYSVNPFLFKFGYSTWFKNSSYPYGIKESINRVNRELSKYPYMIKQNLVERKNRNKFKYFILSLSRSDIIIYSYMNSINLSYSRVVNNFSINILTKYRYRSLDKEYLYNSKYSELTPWFENSDIEDSVLDFSVLSQSDNQNFDQQIKIKESVIDKPSSFLYSRELIQPNSDMFSGMSNLDFLKLLGNEISLSAYTKNTFNRDLSINLCRSLIPSSKFKYGYNKNWIRSGSYFYKNSLQNLDFIHNSNPVLKKKNNKFTSNANFNINRKFSIASSKNQKISVFSNSLTNSEFFFKQHKKKMNSKKLKRISKIYSFYKTDLSIRSKKYNKGLTDYFGMVNMKHIDTNLLKKTNKVWSVTNRSDRFVAKKNKLKFNNFGRIIRLDTINYNTVKVPLSISSSFKLKYIPKKYESEMTSMGLIFNSSHNTLHGLVWDKFLSQNLSSKAKFINFNNKKVKGAGGVVENSHSVFDRIHKNLVTDLDFQKTTDDLILKKILDDYLPHLNLSIPIIESELKNSVFKPKKKKEVFTKLKKKNKEFSYFFKLNYDNNILGVKNQKLKSNLITPYVKRKIWINNSYGNVEDRYLKLRYNWQKNKNNDNILNITRIFNFISSKGFNSRSALASRELYDKTTPFYKSKSDISEYFNKNIFRLDSFDNYSIGMEVHNFNGPNKISMVKNYKKEISPTNSLGIGNFYFKIKNNNIDCPNKEDYRWTNTLYNKKKFGDFFYYKKLSPLNYKSSSFISKKIKESEELANLRGLGFRSYFNNYKKVPLMPKVNAFSKWYRNSYKNSVITSITNSSYDDLSFTQLGNFRSQNKKNNIVMGYVKYSSVKKTEDIIKPISSSFSKQNYDNYRYYLTSGYADCLHFTYHTLLKYSPHKYNASILKKLNQVVITLNLHTSTLSGVSTISIVNFILSIWNVLLWTCLYVCI